MAAAFGFLQRGQVRREVAVGGAQHGFQLHEVEQVATACALRVATMRSRADWWISAGASITPCATRSRQQQRAATDYRHPQQVVLLDEQVAREDGHRQHHARDEDAHAQPCTGCHVGEGP